MKQELLTDQDAAITTHNEENVRGRVISTEWRARKEHLASTAAWSSNWTRTPAN
jgi:hypothetical protein